MLEKLGADCVELRKAEDLEQDFDGLVLPGGESTVQGKLLRELGMYEILKEKIENGMPVLATCAGMILLAEKLENDELKHFGTLPVCVKRNAYGRQLGSFHAEAEVKGIGIVPMTFIRAPYIESAEKDVEVLRLLKENGWCKIWQSACIAFHPELDEDIRIHQKFLDIVKESV